MSTQLRHICFLSDRYGNSVPISFKSYKSKRIFRSAMAGEVIAFSDLFRHSSHPRRGRSGDVFGRQIPVQLFTDSEVAL